MASYSSGKLKTALTATGAFTIPGVSGSPVLSASKSATLTGDEGFAATVTATGAGGTATIDLLDGSTAASVSATVTGGGGVDFEGATLTAILNPQVIYIYTPSTNTGAVDFDIENSANAVIHSGSLAPDGLTIIHNPELSTNKPDEILFTIDDDTDSVTVIHFGATT